MKILYLILFLFTFNYAQFGLNAVAVANSDNYGFEGGTTGNWLAGGASAGISTDPRFANTLDPTSTRVMWIKSNNTNDRMQYLDISITSGVAYRIEYDYNGWDVSAGGAGNQQVTITDGVVEVYNLTSDGTWRHRIKDGTSTTATLDLYAYSARAISALEDTLLVDNWEARTYRDTLWIAGTGSDADEDTVLTLSEAFEIRGSHSGGIFITGAGTFAESITIDSSFSRWEGIEGSTFVDGIVNFNNKTATVVGVRLLQAPTNDANITYIGGGGVLRNSEFKDGYKKTNGYK